LSTLFVDLAQPLFGSIAHAVGSQPCKFLAKKQSDTVNVLILKGK